MLRRFESYKSSSLIPEMKFIPMDGNPCSECRTMPLSAHRTVTIYYGADWALYFVLDGATKTTSRKVHVFSQLSSFET